MQVHEGQACEGVKAVTQLGRWEKLTPNLYPFLASDGLKCRINAKDHLKYWKKDKAHTCLRTLKHM